MQAQFAAAPGLPLCLKLDDIFCIRAMDGRVDMRLVSDDENYAMLDLPGISMRRCLFED